MAGRSAGRAERAAERDLARLPEVLAESLLAATVLELARQVDSPENDLSSKNSAGRTILALMNRLRELAPPEEKTDGIDILRDQRKKRRAGVAKAAHMPDT